MKNMVIMEKIVEKKTIDEICIILSQEEFTSSESNELLNIYDIRKEDEIYRYIEPIKKRIDESIENAYRCKIARDVGPAILKYEDGSFINMHCDWVPDDPYVLKYNKPRVDIGCVFYINDDYVGGELMFFNGKHEQEPYMKLKPNYATCIFFDSSIYHMTAPTVFGTKYSMTTFYQLED